MESENRPTEFSSFRQEDSNSEQGTHTQRAQRNLMTEPGIGRGPGTPEDTRGRVSVPQSGDPRHRAGSSHARVCAHPGRPSKCQLQTDLLEHEARPFPELNSTVGGQQRAGSGGPWLPGAHCALGARGWGPARLRSAPSAPRGPPPLRAPRPGRTASSRRCFSWFPTGRTW